MIEMNNQEKCEFYDKLMALIEPIWDEWCDEGIERDDEICILRFVMEEYENHEQFKRRKN